MCSTFSSMISKLLAVILVTAVLLPSAIKATHIFNHHEHFVCADDIDHSTHFHESDIDCEFYKFKLNNDYYTDSLPLKKEIKTSINKSNLSYYIFLRTHQQDISYLRGPPTLV